MVVITYQYQNLNKKIESGNGNNSSHTPLTVEMVIDSLNNLGAPSEYNSDNDTITTEITPNRPDWYALEGLARTLKTYFYGNEI